MRILLSPTKKMRQDVDSLPALDLPALLPRTEAILSVLKSLSAQQLQALWGCNESIALQNIRRLEQMQLHTRLTPAILSYEGLAFQHMAPSVFEDVQFDYVQQHLRILSGFYGVLRPMDGIRPYRLEMQAKLSVDGCRDLYDFWGRSLYEQSRDEDGVFINLASKEYSKAIEPYLTPADRMVTCIFAENSGGKWVQKATFAKMARGEMVRYLAEIQADSPRQMQTFHALGFSFRPDCSTETEYLFARTD